MKTKSYAVYIYAILLLIGGIIGYIKASSLPSLIMGTLFALLAGASATAMYKNKDAGRISAILLSLVLTAFFCYRFVITQKFMPAGLMVIISLVVVGILYERKK